MCTEEMQPAEDILAEWQESLNESIEYFRRANLEQRERDTAADFLQNLIASLDESEILSSPDDPPDVIYREARFEVKEILDPGRRRGEEYSALLQKALEATDTSEMFSEFTPKDLTPRETGALVLEKAEALINKYQPTFQSTLDLLVYVNLLEHFHKPGPMPPQSDFERFGWRSICAVAGPHSFVFYASETAPQFLRENAGQVRKREQYT